MSHISNFVSLHPYFKAHPGKLEEFKAALPKFAARTASEEGNLFYDFTLNGDEILCREGYRDAGALPAHLQNVDVLLKEALKIADLERLEVHCPAAELEKLKQPLADLKPFWFTLADER